MNKIIKRNLSISMLRLSIFISGTITSFIASAQRVSVDDYADEEDIREFNRYAHFKLTTFEWWSIVIGVVLIIIAKGLKENNKSGSTPLFIIGGLAVLPLVLVILSIAQKIIGYGLVLGAIIAVLYFLFGKK